LGVRVGVYNEPRDGSIMDEAMIKSITGHDMITAMKKYRDPFDFIPIVKIWICTNKYIKFDCCSKPMVDRTNIIMMNAKFITNPKKKNEYKKDKSFITQLCKKYRDEVFTFLCIGANKF